MADTLKDKVAQLMANKGVDVLFTDGDEVTYVGRGNRKTATYRFEALSSDSAEQIVERICSDLAASKK